MNTLTTSQLEKLKELVALYNTQARPQVVEHDYRLGKKTFWEGFSFYNLYNVAGPFTTKDGHEFYDLEWNPEISAPEDYEGDWDWDEVADSDSVFPHLWDDIQVTLDALAEELGIEWTGEADTEGSAQRFMVK
jgi:hypothetical protein